MENATAFESAQKDVLEGLISLVLWGFPCALFQSLLKIMIRSSFGKGNLTGPHVNTIDGFSFTKFRKSRNLAGS